MKVVTAKVPDELTKMMKKCIKEKGYSSQSELVRDAIRRMLEPELKEEIIMDIIEAREQIKRRETISLEELEKSLEGP